MMHRLRRYDVMLRIMMLLISLAMMRCLPQNVAKPHIIRKANIFRRSRHHLPKANIIQKSLICLVDKLGFFVGAPEGTRTPSTVPRKHVLYPIELQAHALSGTKAIIHPSEISVKSFFIMPPTNLRKTAGGQYFTLLALSCMAPR